MNNCQRHTRTEKYMLYLLKGERVHPVATAMPHQSKKTYIEVGDELGKTGSSGKEKDTFIWFNEVDKILGTKPVVDPVVLFLSTSADQRIKLVV